MVVTIERYTETDDGMGGKDYTWNYLSELEGTLDQLSADEVIASERLGQISSHIFITFSIVDVTRKDRMIIDDDIYHIKNVDNPNNLDYQLEILLEYTGDKVEV